MPTSYPLALLKWEISSMHKWSSLPGSAETLLLSRESAILYGEICLTFYSYNMKPGGSFSFSSVWRSSFRGRMRFHYLEQACSPLRRFFSAPLFVTANYPYFSCENSVRYPPKHTHAQRKVFFLLPYISFSDVTTVQLRQYLHLICHTYLAFGVHAF